MVKIISDSTCDLSPALVERYGITILPLHVFCGEKEYADGVDVTPEMLYRWSDDNKATPKTSAPSIAEAVALMKPFVAAGDEVLCFSISDSMSTSGNVMRLAAEELNAESQVTVIDSMNLSTGVGLLVVAAAVLAQQGKTAGEITAEVTALRPKVRASFVVDTLVYLHRGGRCGGLAAMVGSALHLHPKIMVENGAMLSGKKYRGSIDRVIMAYVADLEPAMKNARPERVFITHSGCDDEVVEAVRSYIESLHIFDEILITHAGSVVSSHCGPGTLGVLFIEK